MLELKARGWGPKVLTTQAKRAHPLLLLLAEGPLLGCQWQGDASVVVHGAVINHFFKGPLHEVNVFLVLGKEKKVHCQWRLRLLVTVTLCTQRCSRRGYF